MKSVKFSLLAICVVVGSSCQKILKDAIISDPNSVEMRNALCDCMEQYKNDINEYGDIKECYDKYEICSENAMFFLGNFAPNSAMINIDHVKTVDCKDLWDEIFPSIERWYEK